MENITENIQQTAPVKPNDYLVWAILSTIFCCLPFGIVSIVYASKVDSLWTTGRYAEAEEAARKAKNWFWGAFGTGMAFYLLYTLFIVAVAMMGVSSMRF